jgi:DNA-binding beta-propeller fold protein YncE
LPLFKRPVGVTADASGNFYGTDDEPRVLKVTSAGVTTIVAGNGTDDNGGDGGQASTAAISQPTGVAVDAAGDNGPAINARIDPQDIALDGQGNLYIADEINNRIRKISGGMITTVAGTGKAGYSGDGAWPPRHKSIRQRESLWILPVISTLPIAPTQSCEG